MYAGAWGYRTDGDAGLMHVGARYNDAQVGRPGFARVHAEFITRDTVLCEHPCLYCGHGAVRAVDVTGPVIAGWGPDPIRFFFDGSGVLNEC